MRKISLKNLNTVEVEQLLREQLKDVLGGWSGGTGGGSDTAYCTYYHDDGTSESGTVTNPGDDAYFSSASDFAKAFCDGEQRCVNVECSSI